MRDDRYNFPELEQAKPAVLPTDPEGVMWASLLFAVVSFSLLTVLRFVL